MAANRQVDGLPSNEDASFNAWLLGWLRWVSAAGGKTVGLMCRTEGCGSERHDACLCGLTFELSGRQRQDARPGLAKMYRVPPARAWWPAVGAPLERGVRPSRREARRGWSVDGAFSQAWLTPAHASARLSMAARGRGLLRRFFNKGPNHAKGP